MSRYKLSAVRAGIAGFALFMSIFASGILAPQQASASGWSYMNTWQGKKYYACKYSDTRGRVKVVNTTGSRLTFNISGSTYHVAAYGTTYVSLTKYYSFDVDGHNFSFARNYAAC